MIDRPSGAPIHREIADDLQSAIEAGRWQPGQPIGTLNTLADQYEVNRHTIRAAIRLLESRGVVTVRLGDKIRVRQTQTVVVHQAPPGHQVGVRMPTPADVKRWNLPPGVPMLVLFEVIPPATQEDQEQLVERDAWPGDRARLAT